MAGDDPSPEGARGFALASVRGWATLAGVGLGLGAVGLILLAVAGQPAWLALCVVGFGLVLAGTLGRGDSAGYAAGHAGESGRDPSVTRGTAALDPHVPELEPEPREAVGPPGRLGGAVRPISARPDPGPLASLAEPRETMSGAPLSPAGAPSPSEPPLPNPEPPTTAELIAEKTRAARGPGALTAGAAGAAGLAGRLGRRLRR